VAAAAREQAVKVETAAAASERAAAAAAAPVPVNFIYLSFMFYAPFIMQSFFKNLPSHTQSCSCRIPFDFMSYN
jgi:hypothetical protein